MTAWLRRIQRPTPGAGTINDQRTTTGNPRTKALPRERPEVPPDVPAAPGAPAERSARGRGLLAGDACRRRPADRTHLPHTNLAVRQNGRNNGAGSSEETFVVRVWTTASRWWLVTQPEQGFDRRWIWLAVSVVVLAVLLGLLQRRNTRTQRHHHLCERIELDLAWLLDPPPAGQDALAGAEYARDVQDRAGRLEELLGELADTSRGETAVAATDLRGHVERLGSVLILQFRGDTEPLRHESRAVELRERVRLAQDRLRRATGH